MSRADAVKKIAIEQREHLIDTGVVRAVRGQYLDIQLDGSKKQVKDVIISEGITSVDVGWWVVIVRVPRTRKWVAIAALEDTTEGTKPVIAHLPAPSNVTATAKPYFIELSWDGQYQDIATYEVQHNNAASEVGATSVKVEGSNFFYWCAAGTQRYFRVRAVSSSIARSSWSSWVNATATTGSQYMFLDLTAALAPQWTAFDWDNIAGVAGADMVHDHSAAAEGGQNLRQIQELEFDDATILTIDVNGTVTRTQVNHIIAANAGVADDLDQIDGGTEGDIIIVQPDAGDTITVRHNAGGAGDNIWLAAGSDIVLDNDDSLVLRFNGAWWCDLSGGAGGLVVHDHHDAANGGQDLREIMEFQFDSPTTLTLDAGGAITRTQAYHIIDTFGGAATDDLDTINGGADGDILIIQIANIARTVTVRHGAGNIWLTGASAGGDTLLANPADMLILQYNGTNAVWTGYKVGVHDHYGPEYGGQALNPETLSQRCYLVGPGCPNTTVGGAVTDINAAGPPASGTEYNIVVLGRTTEGGNVTIPSYCNLEMEEGAIIDLGANQLIFSDHTRGRHIRFTGSGDIVLNIDSVTDVELYDVYGISTCANNLKPIFRINSASDIILDRCSAEGTTIAKYFYQVTGSTGVYLYDCKEIYSVGGDGFVIDSSTVYMLNCVADDTVNAHNGLYIANGATVTTERCTFQAPAAWSDVITISGTTWCHHKCDYDANNSSIAGTETPLRDGAVEIPSDAIRSHNSLFPTLGTTTLAQKWGHIYLGTTRDVYPYDDGGGLFQRAPNHWRSPTDHFNAFAGWTWAAYAPFDDAPSTVDVATYPSLLYLINDDTTEDHYCYQSGITTQVYGRLTKGAYSYVGIRLQDGGDDNNDFVELRLIDGTTAGFFALEIEYDVGGVGPTGPTTIVDDIEPGFYLLRLAKIGNSVYAYYTMDSPIPLLINTIAGMTWTADRGGVVFGQRTVASSPACAGLVDYVEMS